MYTVTMAIHVYCDYGILQTQGEINTETVREFPPYLYRKSITLEYNTL